MNHLYKTMYFAATGVGYDCSVIPGGKVWQHVNGNAAGARRVGPMYESREALLIDHRDYLKRAGWMKDAPEQVPA